jgi:hypothetical protein
MITGQDEWLLLHPIIYMREITAGDAILRFTQYMFHSPAAAPVRSIRVEHEGAR